MNNLSGNIDIQKIENNYDNLEILNICDYLLGCVVNDIQFMNDASELNNELIKYFDLGNNKKIKTEDYEKLCRFLDTIYFINEYNKEAK